MNCFEKLEKYNSQDFSCNQLHVSGYEETYRYSEHSRGDRYSESRSYDRDIRYSDSGKYNEQQYSESMRYAEYLYADVK